MNIHQTTERFRSLIPSLEAKNDVELDELDWAAYIIDHWKAITLNDPLIPATSKIRVLTGSPL